MQVDFLLDYDVLTVARDKTLYLLARLVAGSVPESIERRPLNLSVVIDRSGSMAGKKIDYTRQAAQLLVQNMSNDDTLSIVLYNESVETLLPPHQVKNKDLISQRIGEIKAGGTTNLSGGWLEGVGHIAENLTGESINRVLLMSDGLANRGITDPERLVALARQKWESGVSTTTMGLGEDFNEDLLMAMADAGGGAFYFIESPEVAPTIFQEELRGLLSVVGQNLNITIHPTDHISDIRQLNVYPTERKDRATLFRMGDVFGDEIKTLLLQLTIPALNTIGEVQIATLHFEYDEVHGDYSERQSVEIPVTVNIASAELAQENQNDDVTRSVLLLKSAAARREAIQLADQGSYGESAKRLRDAAEAIRKSGLQDKILEEERDALNDQAKDMDRGAEFYQSYSRKSMSTQAYFTSRGSHEDTQALRLREQQRQAGAPEKTEFVPQAESKNIGPQSTGLFDRPIPPEVPAPPTKTSGSASKIPTVMRWRERTFQLDGDLIRIGRAPQNEIVLNTSGISRFHAQIKREDGQLILQDLGSTNGTHVGGQPLDKPHTLRHGDIVYLCDQRLMFEA